MATRAGWFTHHRALSPVIFFHTQDAAMAQLCTGRGPEGGDTNRICVAPTTAQAGAEAALRGVPCPSPTFEEVELSTELGPGAGVDAGGEAGPARLQWLWVTGIATR